MNKRVGIVVALILAASALTAGVLHTRAARWRSVDADRLVAQALSRQNNISYIAHVTTLSAYDGRAVRTHATVFRQGGVERIESAGGSGQGASTITRDGKSYTYLPDTSKLLVTEIDGLLSDNDRSNLLLANFGARCVGTQVIAGRDAYVLEIVSRHTSSVNKRLWIDCKNHSILRTDDYSPTGRRRSSTTMERVTFGARISPRKFALPSSKSARYVMVCKSARSRSQFEDLGFRVTLPAYVPKGYRLEGYHVLHSSCSCRHRSAQLTYTDGLNVISVFQTPRKISCCKTASGARCDDQNCGISTQGQAIRADKRIVVVGDLLPEEIRRIAESVR